MTPSAFCMRCGAPLEEGQAFCMTCGAERPDPGPAAAPSPSATAAGSAAPSPIAAASTFAAGAGRAYGTISMMGGAAALPWQTITTGETPDVRGLIAAGAPIAQSVVRATLRTPAVALLVTTVLDVIVALVSGQPAALRMVGVRAVLGIATSAIGMIAGDKAGPLRRIAGVASIVTGLVQTGSVIWTAVGAPLTLASMLGLLPTIISQLSSLVMLAKTAIVSLKK